MVDPSEAPAAATELPAIEGTQASQAEDTPPGIMMDLNSDADVVLNPTPTDDESQRGDGDDEEEQESEDVGSQGVQQEKKKRRRISPCVFLPEATERLLGEWLEEEVPFIYDKGLGLHKDTQKITKLFNDKAASLDPPISGPELRQWFESNRTRYGRLSKVQSGQGARRFTEREKWILQLFRFLHPHIVRQRKPRNIGIPTVSLSAFNLFAHSSIIYSHTIAQYL